MNYHDASLEITHKHEIARVFEHRPAADRKADEMNLGRPESCKPFRVETCRDCNGFHVRRGGNVFLKV
jgi:hypothetical protein